MYGVSFDSVEANQAFALKHQFPFPLLSDVDRSLALSLGVVTEGDAYWANRMTFVLNEKGEVEYSEETKDAAGQAASLLLMLR